MKVMGLVIVFTLVQPPSPGFLRILLSLFGLRARIWDKYPGFSGIGLKILKYMVFLKIVA